MAKVEFDASDFFAKTALIPAKIEVAGTTAVQASVDDLERIAVNVAPIDTGQLRRSSQKKVKTKGDVITGEVSFSASERGFNYALWTHEYDYNLGPQSSSAGGTDGYSVGNKYLSRPLYGEQNKYAKWWKDAMERALSL
ncbi:hypothetical protein [Mechercharimyces sp. CAU 1602]|uniref:hypothetical protein n=1 Tax=Mechercharimyces sp. CAU 1602 TaxID=2973933 RepID=UPI002161E16A|nr:hypothetical protein [Mechercharimyces sp. CAU 1602]MCS1350320.1 hypothetical protein [Mechercharimyces sp. CAU 1602]